MKAMTTLLRSIGASIGVDMNFLCHRFLAVSVAPRSLACIARAPLMTAMNNSSRASSSQSSPSQGIAQVRMRAFDPVSLQSVASEVVAAGIRAGLSMSGVIPRPKLTRLYTVLRSPHIDKKARDQFHMIVRKRLVIVKSGTPQALGAFQAALEQVDKKGVDLNIKRMS